MSTLNKKLHHKTWFTLVELLVVISILAILWTIAFLSFWGYSSKSRDSVRISDTVNITKWLEIYNVTAWKYPLPDNAVVFTWSTWSIINQWTLWDNVSRILKLSKPPLDPSTNSNYIYSIFNDWKYYQLYYEKENITWYNNPNSINTIYAETITKTPVVKWNYTFDPSLPSLLVVSDSVNSNSWIFDPNVCFIVDWWTNTITSNSWTCLKKSEMSLKDFDSSLVGYWDMETLSGTMLKDLSGNGNDWTFSGGMVYNNALTGGVVGKGLYFNSSALNYIVALNSTWTNNIQTFSAIINPLSENVSGIYFHIIISKNSSWYNWLYMNYRLSPKNSFSSLFKTFDGNYTYLNSNSITDYNKFYYVTSVFDGRKAKIFVNGVFAIESEQLENISILPNSDPIRIWWWINNRYTNCIIDDIKIYNRALSDSEILQQAKIAGF